MVFVRLLSVFLLILAPFIVSNPVRTAKRKVVILSFDGFRYDYYNNYDLPAFQAIAKAGAHAPNGIISAFTTKTFPNHFSIITGLYEENHGIIDNDMYDPLFDAQFGMKNTEPRWWDGGEPAWITAKRQGKKTAAIFWAGSNVKINGEYPNFFLPYNHSITYEMRVNQAVKWLKEDDVDFLAMYFQDPDKTGHKYGIFTKEMTDALQHVNAVLQSFMNQLRTENLLNNIDLIVVSDHGMVNTSNVSENDDLVLYLDKMLDMSDVKLIPQTGSLAGIIPYPGKEDKVYKSLLKHQKHMTVYLKEDIPDRWHYKNHRRITPILAVAEEGYIFVRNKSEVHWYSIGQHGYDNKLQSMRGIFFAQGPSFKSNVVIEPFENVNVYSLICHLLNITPSPNNGTVSPFKNILKTERRGKKRNCYG